MAERALATAFVNLVPGTKDIDTYLKTKLGDDAGTAGDDAGKKMGTGMGNSFMSSFKGIAGAVGLTMGVASVINFFKDSAASLAEEQVGQAQTAAAIKSTGGAAQVTAGQVEGLAQSLEAKTATDADQIRSGENLLLTFTNIKNGVGENNDIFNQATAASVDMARAMGTDVNTAAMQLGKALQDPVAGVAALQRVGVRLSEDQKKQVADFMKVGDAASAQKVILGELSKEFGGSGAAYAGTYAGKMFAVSDAFDDMGKKFMTSVQPALLGLADILTTYVVPSMTVVFGFISDNLAPLAAFAGAVGLITVALNLQAIATAISTAAWWANAAALLANPITWIVIGIGLVVAALVWVATKTTFFQDTWKIMSDFVTAAITAVGKWFSDTWNATVTFFTGIGAKLKAGWDVVSKWFQDGFKNVGKWFSDIWDGAKAVWGIFSGFIMGAADKIGKKFNDVFQGISNFVGDIFNGLIGIIKGPLNGVIGFLNRIVDKINSFSFTVPDWVPGIGGQTIGFNLPHIPALAAGGYVTGPTTALIGEAGPEVVTPLKDFERMMGIDGKSGQTINYYAAPNDSIDAEQKLIDAVQRARVLGWT